MATPSRLEPTVFLAMISPITVGLVAGTVALVLLAGAPLWAAVLAAMAVWAARVFLATRVAKRVRALPRRTDPFALREPWRFYVRDALQARGRFADAIEGTATARCAIDSSRSATGSRPAWRSAGRSPRPANG